MANLLKLKIINYLKKSKVKNVIKNIIFYYYKLLWIFSINAISSKEDDLTIVRNKKNGQILCFPYKNKFLIESSWLKILSLGYQDFILEKYELCNGTINNETILIDCGGFIGAFSIGAILKRKVKHSVNEDDE